MEKSFEQIKKDLEAKKYERIYFLTGEENYYIDYLSNYISTNILTESERAFNQTIVYGRDTSVSAIIDHVMRYPLMAQYNLVIVKEAQDVKDIDQLSSYFENIIDTSILVVNYKYKKLDKRTKFYTSLKNHCCLMNEKKVGEYKISSWIDKILLAKNFRINPQASALLIEHLGNDLNKISNELEKLMLIKHNDTLINQDDVIKHIGISKEYNLFELQKALATRNSANLTRIINHLQANPKAMPIQMLTANLFGYFSKLYILQNPSTDFKTIAQELGVQPFMYQEMKNAIANYSSKLEQVLFIIHKYELRSKGIDTINIADIELIKEMLFTIINV